MTRKATNKGEVRIFDAALNESPLRGGTIVLRGVIDPAALNPTGDDVLLVDDYQRHTQHRNDLYQALQEGTILPDVELGMRGQTFRSKEDAFILQDPVYIIDGLQRINAARRLLQMVPDAPIMLGALIHFDTDRDWEKARFEAVNTKSCRMSPNILLRNRIDVSPALLLLHQLCMVEPNFALLKRVSWDQKMSRQELVSARTLAIATQYLHSHVGPLGSKLDALTSGLDRMATAVGHDAFRQNVMAFWQVIDDCWGVRRVEYREVAPQVKGGFLEALSRLFARHTDFWSGPKGPHRFFIDMDLKRKLGQFPLRDPEIARLANSSGAAKLILGQMLLDHLNSGKRTHRLTRRDEYQDDVSTVIAMPVAALNGAGQEAEVAA